MESRAARDRTAPTEGVQKQFSPLLVKLTFAVEIGAGEGIRTLDPDLGKDKD